MIQNSSTFRFLCIPGDSPEWQGRCLIAQQLLVVVVLSMLVSVSRAGQPVLAENADEFFDVSFGDLQEELALAQEEGKKGVLVMFETEQCPWCNRMKLQVLNRVHVQKYFRTHFRVIALDAEGEVSVNDFEGNEMTSAEFALKNLRVRATPVFAFFGLDGQLITRYTGAVKNDHDFMLLGKYVVEGHYENGRFSKYRRENQSG